VEANRDDLVAGSSAPDDPTDHRSIASEQLCQRIPTAKRAEADVFMAPKICLDSLANFELRKITDSRKFRSKRLFTPKLGSMC
jgi:hypothetical protein